jgi:hypothetical protein
MSCIPTQARTTHETRMDAMSRASNARAAWIDSIVSILLLCGGARWGDACTWQGDAVTTYTDSTPVLISVRYKLSRQIGGRGVELLADTDQTSVILGCLAGTYWVTAYGSGPDESVQSNQLRLLPARIFSVGGMQ